MARPGAMAASAAIALLVAALAGPVAAAHPSGEPTGEVERAASGASVVGAGDPVVEATHASVPDYPPPRTAECRAPAAAGGLAFCTDTWYQPDQDLILVDWHLGLHSFPAGFGSRGEVSMTLFGPDGHSWYKIVCEPLGDLTGFYLAPGIPHDCSYPEVDHRFYHRGTQTMRIVAEPAAYPGGFSTCTCEGHGWVDVFDLPLLPEQG